MISDRAMVRAINSRPQRLAAAHPPGSLLKRHHASQPRQMRATEAAGREADYLAQVRQLPCLCCGMEPAGEAAHVRMASAAFGKSSGLQKKPEDKWALPLCGDDHRVARHAQHNRSEQGFWNDLGINPLICCQRLYGVRGDLVAMRAVVLTTIAERGTGQDDLTNP